MSVLNQEIIARTPYTQLIISKKSPLHTHTFFEFSICISGSMKNQINGTVYDIQKGTVVLLRPDDEHIFYSEKGHVSRDVYIEPRLLKSLCDCYAPDLYETLSTTPLSIFFKLSEYELQNFERKMGVFNNDKMRPEQLHASHIAAIAELLELWYQQQTRIEQDNIPNWLVSLTRQINTIDVASKNINEIIQLTNYAHGYICRQFKKYMGITLQDYVASVKFSFACALLFDPANSIELISSKLHYSSAANFIAAFRRKFGVTPAQWRKSQSHAIRMDTNVSTN